MITRPELTRWLQDPAAQTSTYERIEEIGREIKGEPAAARLSARLEASPKEADALLEIARQALCDGSLVADSLRRMTRAARNDPFFRPPIRNSATEMVAGLWLYEHRLLTIFVAVASADALALKRARRTGSASITFTGQRSVYHFLRAGGATVSLWATDPIGEGFSGTPETRCRLVGRRSLRDGDMIAIDGRCEAFVIDSTKSDIVYCQALTPVGAGPLMVEFDADTHRFVAASSGDETSSRTQMMLSLLRTMERTDAVPVFEELLGSPHFYARWQTLRELVALDADAAFPHLGRMANADPHPEVRAAAAAVLALYEEEGVRCLA
ncbi:MAG TPA: HEAT repeat domain-containing protein [Allosphingosinicella sp.]|nr:HEAT repeat domain-containing protein [Allosphingosinicella sp.]